MFKRILTCTVAFVCLCSVYFINKTPIFSGYSKNFELYIASASSSAKIINVNEDIFPYVFNVKGQAVSLDKNVFNLDEFLKDFSARTISCEELENGTIYYAYSPKVKYKKKVGAETVNLQIYVGEYVKIGSPIIFGSF